MSSGEWIRMLYGFVLLLVLSVLAGMFALGKVYQESSYGLMPLIVALASLATTFANWAFQHRRGTSGDNVDTTASPNEIPPEQSQEHPQEPKG